MDRDGIGRNKSTVVNVRADFLVLLTFWHHELRVIQVLAANRDLTRHFLVVFWGILLR